MTKYILKQYADKKTNKSPRVQWIDILRGISIISMVAFHAMWDYVYLYNHDITWYKSVPGYVWQQSICITFIFIAGLCRPFSKNPLKKGLILIGCSIGVSIVTGIAEPQAQVHFGVLSLIGCGMLVFIIVEKYFIGDSINKKRALCLMLLSLGLFLVTKDVNKGWLGFFGIRICNLPAEIYRNTLTAFLGFPGKDFVSSDYFSFVPWIFLFAAGYFARFCINKVMVRKEKPISCLKPISFIGRHSLAIYLIHQPLIMLVFYIIQIFVVTI